MTIAVLIAATVAVVALLHRAAYPPAAAPLLTAAPAAENKFDLDDPVYRAALREVDEVVPAMPVAPPRDERDMTEAEKTAAQAVREAMVALEAVGKQRRVLLEAAEKTAPMWAATAITTAVGEYLLPNGTHVSYEEVKRRGWVAIVAEQLADSKTVSWYRTHKEPYPR